MVLTIESAYTSSAAELIGAGYDRLDFQKRYATCNFKLPGRLNWLRADVLYHEYVLRSRKGFNSFLQ